MSDTINIGGITVSKFYLGGSSDVKIYLGTTKLYPHLQEPCFAVVDNISTYTARTYVDVYETSSDKWYKLNNLNAYEEYGIYGSGRTITYYEGKLTIDGDYEYQYSGNSWANVGAISGSSRVPAGYTEVEYIETDKTQYIDTGIYLNTSNFEVGYTIVGNSSCWGYCHQMVANGTWLGVESAIAWYGRWSSNTTYRVDMSSYLTSENNTIVYKQNGVTINGSTVSKSLTMGRDSIANKSLLFFGRYDFYKGGVEWQNNFKAKSLYIKNNGELVRDFVPAKRDSDSEYGMYDLVTNTFYTSPNGNSFSGGAETGSTEYPVYYDEIQDPPDNVVFSSMTEAEEYECPWVGMTAFIDGDKYVFSGDSQSGYEWVIAPIDYTKTYLTFEPISSAVAFRNSTKTFQYSLDYGSTWTTLTTANTVTVNVGQKMMVKGNFGAGSDDNNGNKFITSGGTWKAYGNVLSLVDSDNYTATTAISSYQLINLFRDCTTLVDVDNLKIPAYTVSDLSIRGMFRNCSSLVHVPSDLLSTFTALTGAYCSMGMFEDCSSLLETPIIPDVPIGSYGLWGMFNNCTSLTACTCLLTNSYIGGNMTGEMLNGVNTANGVFYKNPNATWQYSDASIPSGWSIQDYSG